MQCPVCDAELTAETTVCPVCGRVAYIETVFAPHSSANMSDQSPPFSIQPATRQSPVALQQVELQSSRTALSGRKGFLYGGVIFLILLVAGSGFFLYIAQASRATLPSSHASSQIAPPTHSALPTPAMIPNPYSPYSGTLVINDALRDNRAGYDWMDDTIQPTPANRGCRFTDGAYHIISDRMPHAYMDYCLALQSHFSNFAYQIQATLLQGDEIGVVFRQSPSYRYYYFYIRRDGSYGLLWTNGANFRLLQSGFSAAIYTGLHEPNVLAVVAQGNMLNVYANHQHLASVTDTTYISGRIGTAVGSTNGDASDGRFNNLMLWAL